jgi:two-component system cell cycle sensor histidine kinase/response regulator CckA
LAVVGQLPAGIAHDFNNIMAVIVLYSKLLTWLLDLPSQALDRLKTISQQAQQATELIGQILDFSRCSVLERQPLDLAPLLREMMKMLQRTLPENIQMELVCEASEYTVNADPTRMQQVFMNLVVNAHDAMLPKGGGTLRIELTRMQVDDTKSAPVEEMQPGEWVQVAVIDTGTGIPSDVLPRIFDPFFTTKAPGKGMGLGLAQVYGIVTQHKGHIDVSTAVGQGTAFILYLPALPAPGEEMRAAETSGPVEGHGETVLVVEDHIAARKALRDTLETLDYRVLEARDGQEALAVFEQYSAGPGQRVDLVLTDLVMPVMDGQALFHALRQRDPTVKVVVMTGHPLEEELEDLRLKGLVGLIKKPLNLEQLTQVVSRALEES